MLTFEYWPRLVFGEEFEVTAATAPFWAHIPGKERGKELVAVRGLVGLEDVSTLAAGGEMDSLGLRQIRLPVGARVVRVAAAGFVRWAARCPGGELLSAMSFRVDRSRLFSPATPTDELTLNDRVLSLPHSDYVSIVRSDSLVGDLQDCLAAPDGEEFEEDLGGLPSQCPSWCVIEGAKLLRGEYLELHPDGRPGAGSHSFGFSQLPLGTQGRLCEDDTVGAYWLARTPHNQWLGVVGTMILNMRRAEDRQRLRPASHLTPAEAAVLQRHDDFFSALNKWWELNAHSDLTPSLAAFRLLGAF